MSEQFHNVRTVLQCQNSSTMSEQFYNVRTVLQCQNSSTIKYQNHRKRQNQYPKDMNT